MSTDSNLGPWVAAWTVAAAVIILSRARRGSIGAGLVTAFVVSFALGYWFGAAIYLLPWDPTSEPDIVATGFHQSTYALIAFGVGVLLTQTMRKPRLTARAQTLSTRIPEAYVGVGLACFLVLLPALGRVPTAGALLSQGWNLLIVGLGLACWRAWRTRSRLAFAAWLCAALCLPLVTVITQGFLGYGAGAAIAVLAFIASFYRPRWRIGVAGFALAYVALSLYVTYMRDRQEIRDAVWGDEPVLTRMQRVQQTLATMEWLDLSNPAHLARIDLRLNQNYLVGRSVNSIEAGVAPYSYGQNLWDGLLNLIPRAIWPSKPFVAGSGDVVSRYTGITFASGTSVGIGHVLEAYISFGTFGVIVFFFILGVALTLVDIAAGRRLLEEDWLGFACWFLPALSVMPAESSIAELTSSAGAAWLVAYLVNRLFMQRFVHQSLRLRRARAAASA